MELCMQTREWDVVPMLQMMSETETSSTLGTVFFFLIHTHTFDKKVTTFAFEGTLPILP